MAMMIMFKGTTTKVNVLNSNTVHISTFKNDVNIIDEVISVESVKSSAIRALVCNRVVKY